MSERWDPLDPAKGLLRRVSAAPSTIDPEDFREIIPVLQRTGFHGALNYYRSIDSFWSVATRAYAGARISQPTFFVTGREDGLNAVRQPTKASLRKN